MADSLVLVGVKDVRKHTGTEMLLLNPLRGGNTHQVKEWWRNGVNTTYTGCTIFRVTTAVGSVKLALATGKPEGAEVRIDHDGNFNFSFYQMNEIERAALFTDDMEIIEHYVFPSMSGGKIMTVTPAGAADRPTAGPPPAPDTTVDSVTVQGEDSPTVGSAYEYNLTVAGDATPYTYAWEITGDGTINGASNEATLNVTWNSAGAGTVKCTVGSTNANWDNATQDDTLSVNATVVFAVLVAAADASYVVTESGGDYYIDGVANDTITANAGETIHFDLSDASLSGHPFTLYTDSTKTTAITVGVEQQGTDLLFTPPISGTFSYQCSAHADMGGDIVIN